MATVFIHHPVPQFQLLWRPLALCTLLALVTACGVVDYSLRNIDDFASSPANSDAGAIYFHYADDAEPYVVHVNRTNRGYGFKTALYESDEGDTTTNLVATRSKDYKYFIGVETRYSF